MGLKNHDDFGKDAASNLKCLQQYTNPSKWKDKCNASTMERNDSQEYTEEKDNGVEKTDASKDEENKACPWTKKVVYLYTKSSMSEQDNKEIEMEQAYEDLRVLGLHSINAEFEGNVPKQESMFLSQKTECVMSSSKCSDTTLRNMLYNEKVMEPDTKSSISIEIEQAFEDLHVLGPHSFNAEFEGSVPKQESMLLSQKTECIMSSSKCSDTILHSILYNEKVMEPHTKSFMSDENNMKKETEKKNKDLANFDSFNTDFEGKVLNEQSMYLLKETERVMSDKHSDYIMDNIPLDNSILTQNNVTGKKKKDLLNEQRKKSDESTQTKESQLHNMETKLYLLDTRHFEENHVEKKDEEKGIKEKIGHSKGDCYEVKTGGDIRLPEELSFNDSMVDTQGKLYTDTPNSFLPSAHQHNCKLAPPRYMQKRIMEQLNYLISSNHLGKTNAELSRTAIQGQKGPKEHVSVTAYQGQNHLMPGMGSPANQKKQILLKPNISLTVNQEEKDSETEEHLPAIEGQEEVKGKLCISSSQPEKNAQENLLINTNNPLGTYQT